jgi:hypothetical protein
MIGDLFGALGGGAATFLLPNDAMKYYKKPIQLYEGTETPEYDMDALAPYLQQMVAQYDPSTYQGEPLPGVSNLSDSPELRTSQLKALKRLEQVAGEGLPEQDRLIANEIQQAMLGGHRRTTNAALEDLAARGRLGGGTELRARLAAGQQAAEMGRGMGSDLQRQGISNRLNAIQQSGNLSGDIRAQDVDTTRQAAEIINRYNLAGAQMAQQSGLANAQMMNQGKLYNAQTQNQNQAANAQMQNQFQMRNQDTKNALLGRGYQDTMQKNAALSGAYGNYGSALDAERAGRINAIAGIGKGVGSIGDSILSFYGGGMGGL